MTTVYVPGALLAARAGGHRDVAGRYHLRQSPSLDQAHGIRCWGCCRHWNQWKRSAPVSEAADCSVFPRPQNQAHLQNADCHQDEGAHDECELDWRSLSPAVGANAGCKASHLTRTVADC